MNFTRIVVQFFVAVIAMLTILQKIELLDNRFVNLSNPIGIGVVFVFIIFILNDLSLFFHKKLDKVSPIFYFRYLIIYILLALAILLPTRVYLL